MNLNMVNGTIVNIAMDTVNNFNYRNVNVNTAITELSIPEREVSIYPNPSNGKVSITLNIREPGRVKIDLIAINGELINSFYAQENEAGDKSISVNLTSYQGAYLTSGIYLCRITTALQTITKKIIICQ